MLEEMVCFQYTNDISRMFKNSDHKNFRKRKTSVCDWIQNNSILIISQRNVDMWRHTSSALFSSVTTLCHVTDARTVLPSALVRRGVSIMASMQVRAQSQVTAYFQFRRTPVWYCSADLLARPLLYGCTFEVAMTVEQQGLNQSLVGHRSARLCLAIQPILNSQSQRSHRSRFRVVMLCFSLITVWMVLWRRSFP